MDKSEQVLRALKERERKNDIYIKVITTLTLILTIMSFYILSISINLVERKVDYRYFNLVTSLEKIDSVYIDTYDGTAYKTQEELKAAKEKHPIEASKKRGFIKKYIRTIGN